MENKDLLSKQAAPKQRPLNSYLKFSGLAIQMMVTIGVMVYAGYRLDLWLGIKFPAFLLTFTLMSLIGSIYWLYRAVK